MKNLPGGFSCRLPVIEENIRELEDESIGMIQNEAQGESGLQRKLNKAILSMMGQYPAV